MFTLYADDQNLTVTSRDVIPSGSVKSVDVKFTFSDDWNGITKLAVFKCIDRNGGSTTAYSATLSSGQCTIPWEVLVEENEGFDCFAGIYGTSGSTVVMPTVWANLGKVKAGAVIGENSAEPTASVYEQFVEDIADYATAAANSATAAANSATAAADSASDAAKAAAEAYDDVIAALNGITWELDEDDGGLNLVYNS